MIVVVSEGGDAGLHVLYEDDGLLVVRKPAGLVCHPTKGDARSSLIARLRLHRDGLPVYLVNRLDRETSGVTIAAKAAVAAGELGRLFETRVVRKTYEALVEGWVSETLRDIAAPLGRAEGAEVAIQDAVRPDGTPAVTRIEMVRRFERGGERFSHLRIEPVTGRKHQIRIHLAHVGHPIVGDKIYGGDPARYLRFVCNSMTDEDRSRLRLENQALHASRLAFSWRGREWEFRADPEPEFSRFLAGE